MTDAEFDAALVAAAFTQGAEEGWMKVSAAGAAQRAGLDLTLARVRFGGRSKILKKFGELADIHALKGASREGELHDLLFDILLRRFDFLQMHRAGVLALLKAAPLDPALSLWLGKASLSSMGWLLEAVGVPAAGLMGALRKKGLLAVWLWGTNAWAKDESEDLAGTMAAVDVALKRAGQIAARLTIPTFAGDPASSMPVEPASDIPVEPASDIPVEPAGFTAEDEPPPAMT
jgi:hypothetical protein